MKDAIEAAAALLAVTMAMSGEPMPAGAGASCKARDVVHPTHGWVKVVRKQDCRWPAPPKRRGL